MPVVIRGKMEGLEALAQNLRDLGAEVGGRFQRAGTAAGSAVVRNEAAAHAPVLTGKTKAAVFMVRDRQQSGNGVEVYHIGVRSGKKAQRIGKKKLNLDAWYWKFNELGHFARHALSRRRDSSGKRLLKQAIARPRWISAKPFLRPALEHKRQEAAEKVRDTIASRIRNWAARLRRGRAA